jgi:outer membrane lipoprotein-sorting protein
MCFDGTNIWDANNDNNYVTKLMASDGTIIGTYTVGQNPGGICFDGTNIWVVNGDNNNVIKLRASDGTTVGTYMVGQHPDAICFDGTNIWILCYSNNSLTKLDPIDGSLLGTYAVTPYTAGICFDGSNIWVFNIVNNTVTKIPITIPLTTTQSAVITAQSGDTVEVDYTLKLVDGTVYQTTVGTGNPFQFTLGQGQVIAGFDAAVTGMAVGQTKTVTIPAAQAYGTTPSASNPLAGQDLTFIITLLKIIPQ